jgi:hypothetical protein
LVLTIFDLVWDALNLDVRILDHFLDVFGNVELWVLIHELDPFDEGCVSGNDDSTFNTLESFEFLFELDKFIRLFGLQCKPLNHLFAFAGNLDSF